jgi:hypothetical protein
MSNFNVIPTAAAVTKRPIVCLMVSFLLATSSAVAGPKVAPDMPKVSANTPVDIIVRFRTLPTKDELQTIGTYGQLKKIFNSIKAIHAQVPLSVVSIMEADSNVVYISPNRPLKGTLEFAEPTVNANIASSMDTMARVWASPLSIAESPLRLILAIGLYIWKAP